MKSCEKRDGRYGKKMKEQKKRSDGKKILLLTKCKGHSLVQRWSGKDKREMRKKIWKKEEDRRKEVMVIKNCF